MARVPRAGVHATTNPRAIPRVGADVVNDLSERSDLPGPLTTRGVSVVLPAYNEEQIIAQTVTRCAARSTCGKPGFATCCFASAGTCTNGLCQDRTTPCTDSSTCPIVIKCHIKSSPAECSMAGGSPGSGSCCDAVCSVSPSGAFLDAAEIF